MVFRKTPVLTGRLHIHSSPVIRRYKSEGESNMVKGSVKHGLGRGLGALIDDNSRQNVSNQDKQSSADSGILRVSVDKISKNTLQPRKSFDDESLSELIDSVKERGILQPLLVREVTGGRYELIAGERRLRAAGEAGLTEVPVIVLRAGDVDSLLIALLENLQREDLNVMEEAEGYQALSERFNLTQLEISRNLGKSRAGVANAMRLLGLHEEVKDMVRKNLLTAGHAKIIAGLEIKEEQLLVAKKIVSGGVSVRGLEKMIRKMKSPGRKPSVSKLDMPKDFVTSLCDQLHSHFGTAVRIYPCKTYANGRKGKGSIEIDFYSNDDLDRILSILRVYTE